MVYILLYIYIEMRVMSEVGLLEQLVRWALRG